MPYSALFAQSKSYFTHKVRGCQTFLQRIDKLFFILIYHRHFLCPPFRISVSVPLTLPAAEPDIVPRRGFIRSPAPPEPFFCKRISPRRILPINLSTKHSCRYFFGFASAFSDRTVQLSAWIIGIRRAAQDIPTFPPKREKRDCRPPLSSYSPHICLPRARPPCAPFELTAPCKHPHREPSAYLPQSLLPPYRTPILSQTYKNPSSAIKLNGEKQ